MNYYVYETDIMKDVSKVDDQLKVGSPHHDRSYFWWGGGIEIEKTQEKTMLIGLYKLSLVLTIKLVLPN